MKEVKKNIAHLRFAVLACDVALFTLKGGELFVRLITVNRPPHFSGTPGLPGGLLLPQETAEDAVLRHVQEKAHIDTTKIHIEQLYTFSQIDRDPRGRVVAVAYLALVPWEKLSPTEQEDSGDARWVPVRNAKRLAYDHDDILSVALERLSARVTYTTLVGKLMPPEFTLTDLERAYAAILSTDLDKRNFRKKILKLKILKKLPYKRTGVRSRPAALYRFARSKVEVIEVL